MINRQLLCVLICGVGLLSCKPQRTHPYTLEIIKLGLAEHFDTAGFSKVGGPVYVRYQQGADSMFMKLHLTMELLQQELYDGNKQRATYFHQYVNDSLAHDFQYVIDYLKPIRDGRLPDNHRNSDIIGCNLLDMQNVPEASQKPLAACKLLFCSFCISLQRFTSSISYQAHFAYLRVYEMLA